jgi:hypothetical protein
MIAVFQQFDPAYGVLPLTMAKAWVYFVSSIPLPQEYGRIAHGNTRE